MAGVALILLCFVTVKYSANIRNFLGIWKDWAEFKKTKLETLEIKRKKEHAESRVRTATDDEIKAYDPNTHKLLQKIKEANPFEDYAFLFALVGLFALLLIPMIIKALSNLLEHFLNEYYII